MPADNATTRFSDRVAAYVRCRPGYPREVVDVLQRECGLRPGSVVADIGSGTGIFTRLLLEAGATVWAVEPNEAMRRAAEQALGVQRAFRSVAARAEATTLPGSSVDLVTAAQAFHWFDRDAVRIEFARILRPGGCVALLWNDRRTNDSAFAEAYEALLHNYAIDYAQVNHRNVGAAEFDQFFGPGNWRKAASVSFQEFDFAGLRGRLESSSYAPPPAHPNHAPMIAELRRLFDAHQQAETVRMAYDTRIYWGAPGTAFAHVRGRAGEPS